MNQLKEHPSGDSNNCEKKASKYLFSLVCSQINASSASKLRYVIWRWKSELSDRATDKELEKVNSQIESTTESFVEEIKDLKFPDLELDPYDSSFYEFLEQLSEHSSILYKRLKKLVLHFNTKVSKRTKAIQRGIAGQIPPSQRWNAASDINDFEVPAINWESDDEGEYEENIHPSQHSSSNAGIMGAERRKRNARYIRNNSGGAKAGHRPRYKDNRRNRPGFHQLNQPQDPEVAQRLISKIEDAQLTPEQKFQRDAENLADKLSRLDEDGNQLEATVKNIGERIREQMKRLEDLEQKLGTIIEDTLAIESKSNQ